MWSDWSDIVASLSLVARGRLREAARGRGVWLVSSLGRRGGGSGVVRKGRRWKAPRQTSRGRALFPVLSDCFDRAKYDERANRVKSTGHEARGASGGIIRDCRAGGGGRSTITVGRLAAAGRAAAVP